ncbi:MAG TPA: PIN domain-containing protein [Solirubrobacterales bacterium]|nr:PIN domain-containing protein [Solirubrobacterales bacterium]
MVLADTSVWVDFARRGDRGRAGDLRGLLDGGEVSTCGPVVAELLAGAEGEVAERISATLASLPWAGLDPGLWREVGVAARRLRKLGHSMPLTDLVIAVAAARAEHVLWSFDSDFEQIREVIDGLSLYSATN